MSDGQVSDPPPRRRMAAEKRRAIVAEAALGEFARRGYDDTSMGSIAAASGVTRAVLYDHFASKRALFEELLETQGALLLRHLEVAIASRAPLRERMRATLDTLLRFAEQQPFGWWLLFPEREPVDAEAAADYRRRRAIALAAVGGLLAEDAVRAGLDPAAVSTQAAFAVWQAAVEGAIRWWRDHSDVPREQLLDATMTVLWTGISGLSDYDGG